MELLYLWLGNYNNIEGQEFNFSKEFSFHFDESTQTLSVNKKKNRFSSLIGKQSGIRNITGIIGQNGSGKTTLLEYLSKWILNININHVIVFDIGIGYTDKYVDFKYTGNDIIKLKGIPSAGFHTKDDDITLSNIFFPQNRSIPQKCFIYYNPIFDNRHVWRHSGYCEDISTNYILSDPELKYRKGNNGAVLSYKYDEIMRSLDFIHSDLRIQLPFSVPDYYKIYFSTRMDDNFYHSIRGTILYKIFEQLVNKIGAFYDNISKDKYLQETPIELVPEIFTFLAIYAFVCDLNKRDNIAKETIIEICNSFSLPDGGSLVDSLVTINLPNNISNEFKDKPFNIKEYSNYLKRSINANNIVLVPFDVRGPIQEPFAFMSNYIRWMNIDSTIVTSMMDEYGKTVLDKEYLDFFPPYSLSSGEGAFLTMYSRFYSVRNKVKKDESIIIMIDEGEAGFHPQWQKRYIKDIVDFIPKIFPSNDIQLIIASNSPFIASDLPKSSIIFLKKRESGECRVMDSGSQNETFAANIYDLYKNSFFMQKGFIGEFANEKIQYVIDILLDGREGITEKELLDIKSIIEIIGEPILKRKIAEIWDKKHGEKLGFIIKGND